MPFDGKVSDYFETKPAPVYGKDNPPTRMSEAIRMAVADVEAATARGFVWKWDRYTSEENGICFVCTAGAVAQRLHNFDGNSHSGFITSDEWWGIMRALSGLTFPRSKRAVEAAFEEWPEGFFGEPMFKARIVPFSEDPAAFKRDMLALADRLEAEGS